MLKIILEPADNGVIKRVEDNNINGAGEMAIYSVVYEIDGDEDFDSTTKFLYEVAEDLGLHLGNKRDKRVLRFDVGWGEGYEPNKEELERKKKELEADLKFVKECLKTYD